MAGQNLAKFEKQTQFIGALVQLGSIEAACHEVKISRATYYKWLKDEQFQEKIEKRKHFIHNSSIDHMVKLFENALGIYEKLLLFSRNESIQLRAASSIIKNSNIIISTKKNAEQYQDWAEMQHENTIIEIAPTETTPQRIHQG